MCGTLQVLIAKRLVVLPSVWRSPAGLRPAFGAFGPGTAADKTLYRLHALYANAAAGKINTEAYGLNKDEMASVMAATIKTYHLSSAVTDLGYETNAAGVVTAVTFTGSSGMTSAMESMTNSDDEVIAQ